MRTLYIKWGTSRGRDTYGYTTCTLRENGTKLAACNGGGYDTRLLIFSESDRRKLTPEDMMIILEKFDSSAVALTRWLAAREDDIAVGIEDFGELRQVFSSIIGRQAKSA